MLPSLLPLVALSSELCAPRGCHGPHHVGRVSRRLPVSSHGPVCGCWTFRFHNPYGLLSSWSHLSTWLRSAGGRRVRRRCQIRSWGYCWQHSREYDLTRRTQALVSVHVLKRFHIRAFTMPGQQRWHRRERGYPGVRQKAVEGAGEVASQ